MSSGTSSAAASLEKVAPKHGEYDGRSYRSLVSSMREKHPNLASLEEVLKRNSESGRAVVIEFYDADVTLHRFHHSNELLAYLDRQEESPSEGNRRLYLLEGLPSNYIEILGSRLRIDPNVFARQVNCGILEVGKDVRDIPLLSSHPTSKESFHVRYNELRDFGDRIRSYDLRCVEQRRKISVTKWNGKFDGVGIIHKNASFWFRMTGERGWNALILLDPPVGGIFYVGSGTNRRPCSLPSSLYRGGFVDFSSHVNSTLEFDNATAGPERISPLDDLCYYYTKSELTRQMDFSSPAGAAVFLKRYVASHWMVLLRYSLDLLHKYEHTYHRASRFADLSSSLIENCWSDVQYLNDRTAGWCEQVDGSINQFKASGTLGNFPKQQTSDLAQDDFIYILDQFRGLKQRVQTVISSMTGLLSILEAMRMKELTNLGLAFLPLAFTSSIFSMSGNYAPGGSSFWVYWAVATPLVLLVFVVAFRLNSILVLVKSWLLKPRLFNHSATERVPKGYLGSSVC